MEWTIKKEHNGMMIRDYLQSVQAFSRRIIKAVKFDGGAILVNGMPQTVRFCLTTGDNIEIQLPPEKKGECMQPEEIPLSIVYEDEDVIVINKLQGIAVIPSRIHPTGTIANGILGYYEKSNIPYTVHIVTRLDKDTSGLMLIAKHRYSHSLLAASHIAGKVKRKYKALIEGQLEKRVGKIDAPIGRKEGSIIERTVTKTGKSAITNYEVEAESRACSIIDVELETGRTHQIRVHFSHIGHPLLGDDLYGGSTENIKRQALHCCEISFEHPLTKKELSFKLGLPDDMNNVL